ncbi:MAG: DNA-binding domain-containing protein [Bacteroidota bacterium]
MIQYFLMESSITHGDYIAMVQTATTKRIDDVADAMISRGSTVTKAEVLSVLEEFRAAILSLVEEGHSIVTPVFKITPSISGTFRGPDDCFDDKRHTFNVRINAGLQLKAPRVKLKKIAAKKPMPILAAFKDLESGTTDSKITPGGIASISGHLLRFDKQDPQQGIFFTARDGTVTRVTTVVRHMPSELIFAVPNNLAPGKYSVSVRTILKSAKDLREGILNRGLEVS